MLYNPVSREEQEALIRLGSGERVEYNSSETFVSLFREQVALNPEATALVDEVSSITYAELDRKSDILARNLLQAGVEQDSVVAIMLPRRKEFIIAVLGVFKAGGAYVALDSEYPAERLQYMLEDAEAKVMIDNTDLLEGPYCGPVDNSRPESLACLIYTSGSTGKPKGVMIEHRNLRDYVFVLSRIMKSGERWAEFASFSFGASIVSSFGPLGVGATLHILSSDLRRSMDGMARYFIDNDITGIIFDTQVGSDMLTGFENLHLRKMLVGGEALKPVKPRTSEIQVINFYGLSEHLLACSYVLEHGKDYDRIPIGRPLPNVTLFVVDEEGRLLPRGEAGELCLVGKMLTRGYWKQEELTKEKYTDCPFLSGERMYHTGDLVRWNEDGYMEYLGRTDNQVQLRSIRIELGEIENRAYKFEGVRQAAARLYDERFICLYYTATVPIDKKALKGFISEALPGFMVPTVFMQLGSMPLTPSGKIDRKLLPEPEIELDEIVPPASETERKLFDIVAEILKMSGFGVTNNLISLGFSSLSAMRLTLAVHQRMQAQVKMADIMKEPTVRGIAAHLSSSVSKLPSYERRALYPLTENQRGVYIDWEMNRDTTQYNIASVYRFGSADAARLAEALKATVETHSYLKTRLTRSNGAVMQERHDDEAAVVDVTALDQEPGESYFQERVRPFDLFNDRLYRMEVITTLSHVYLFIDIHHIIFDGLSASIFMGDMLRAYQGGQLLPESYELYDFALYEQEMAGGEVMEEAEAYFDGIMSAATTLRFPDSARPDGKAYARLETRIPSASIDAFCQVNGVTAGSFMQAAFTEAMSRLTRERGGLHLTLSSGRGASPELMSSVGMFVKTLPVVRPTTGEGATTAEFVKSVDAQLRQSYAHESYPYTRFVERHGVRAEVMFVYQGGVLEGGEIEGAEQRMLDSDLAKFPITVTAYPRDDAYVIVVEYDGRRYGSKDMGLLAKAIGNMSLSLSSEKLLSEARTVSAGEAAHLLELGKGRTLEYDASETLVDLFRLQVEKTPDALAVVFQDRRMTYRELDELTDRLATQLVSKYHVDPEEAVGVMIERSELMVVYPLAIMKAGAAYMPLDFTFPAERLKYMCKDAGVRLILSEGVRVQEAMTGHAGAVFTSDMLGKLPAEGAAGIVSRRKALPDNRYVILYTSGSTGQPKGVALEHHGIVNFCHWCVREFDLTPEDRVAAYAHFGFDVHQADFWPALSCGASVFIIPSELRLDLPALHAYIVKERLSYANMTTQIGHLYASLYPESSLRVLSVAGEKLPALRKPEYRMYNSYGPTEATVYATTLPLKADYADDSIGRPLDNYSIYIVDDRMQLVPRGLPGELLIAGAGVARGYLNQPGLTADKFIKFNGLRAYRSGDLARWREDGAIDFLGRIDSQVKLRGLRIELGEIENRALSFAGIRQVVVDVREINGVRNLCCYYTVKDGMAMDEYLLQEYLKAGLAEYMIPSAFMQLDGMPLTPNGKIDRKCLPEPVMTSAADYIEPASDAERAVSAAMQQVLGMDTPVGALDGFYELGGDSIKAIRLVGILRQKGLSVQVADVMKLKTVRAIAAAVQDDSVSISQESWSGALHDSAIFSWLKDQHLADMGRFHLSMLLGCRERVEATVLQQAVDAVVFHHDMLRAVIRDGQLYVRGAETRIPVAERKLGPTDKIGEACSRIAASMDMAEGLFLPVLLHASERDFLFLCTHHAVVDGVSWRILTEDLETAYRQRSEGLSISLPEKTVSYRDYVDAQHAYRNSYLLGLEIPFWERQQKLLLQLPVSDGKRLDRCFARISVHLDAADTRAFSSARLSRFGADVNDLLLTAVGRSYRRLTGMDSMSVQLEGHGREPMDAPLRTDRTVGWFTSIYPVILILGDDIRHDLRNVKEALHRIPGKGMGYNILRYVEGDRPVSLDRDRVPRIGFNYLGVMDGEKALTGGFFTMMDSWLGPHVRKEHFGPELDLSCMVVGGIFSLTLDYDADKYGLEEAERFASGILWEINALTRYLDSHEEQELTATDLGENEWTDAQFEHIMADYASRGERLQRIYPLTPMQEGILLKHLQEPESWAYRLVSIYELDCNPTEAQLRRVLERLARRHEVLRTAIIHDGVEQYRQAIVDRPLGMRMTDLSQEKNPEEAVKALRRDMLTHAFDLQRRPLMQVVCAKKGDGSCYLVIGVHHIIVDGWSLQLCLGDFFRFLQEECQGKSGQTEVPVHDGHYEAAVREILAKDNKKSLDYWRGLLEGYATSAGIPSWGEVPAAEQSAEDGLSIQLDAATTQRLTKLCQQEQATLGNAVELAWGLVLQTCSRTDDVVFVKVVSGRDNTDADVSDIVGLFINSVPVRVQTGKDSTARQMLRTLQHQAAESNAFDFCALSEIQQLSETGDSLFQTVTAFENYSSGVEALRYSDFGLNIRPLQTREESFEEISQTAYVDDGGRLVLNISFNRRHYRRVEAERVLCLFKTLLTGIAQSPDIPLATLPLLQEEEEKDLSAIGMGEISEFEKSDTFVSLFRRQAEKTPDALAVVFQDKRLTYRELDELTDRLAAELVSKYHVEPEEAVGVMIDRSELMVVYPLAIMKAGAAYMPLDFHFPAERLQYMCGDAEVRLILSETDRVREAMPDFRGNVFTADSLQDLSRRDGRLPGPQPACRYVILYTSGSTGRPKGVALEHHGIVNFCHWYVKEFRMTAEDRSLAFSNFGFDAHMMDIYPALSCGASVWIVESGMRMDLDRMNRYMEENGVNIAFLTTQVGHFFASSIENHSLRLLSVSGEKLMPVRKPPYTFYNCCGHTECTIYTTFYKIESDYDSPVIGRPLANYRLYVVDPSMRLLPRGMAGELIICGEGVGRGYLHPSEKDADKFTDFMGERAYRTGDLVRWNEDGDMEYLGRIDNQVKLRGLRIELGEIEACATRFGGIAMAAASVRRMGGSDGLCLHYSAKPGTVIDEDALKAFLAESLADYMVPVAYVQLDKMPLNANGKIDRRRLPEPQASAHTREAPATELEEKLSGVFCALLGIDSLGVTDELRAVGLNSILAMKARIVLQEQLGLAIDVAAILKLGNVRKIANHVAGGGARRRELFHHHPMQKLYPVPKTLETYMADYKAGKPTFTVASGVRLEGARLEVMEKALRTVFAANPSMKARTAFMLGKPLLLRDDSQEIPITKHRLDYEPDAEQLFGYCWEPLKIVGGFLGNYALIETPTQGFFVFMGSHGNMDGASMNLMIMEFCSALKGIAPEPEKYTVFDYALDEQDYLGSEALCEDEEHYCRMTGDMVENVLPFDDEPEDETGYAETVKVTFDKSATDRYCEHNRIRQSSFFAHLYMQAFGHMGGWDRVMISSLHSNRSHAELAGMMSLAMRNFPLVCRHVVPVDDPGFGAAVLAGIHDIERQMDDAMNISFYDYYGSNGLGRKSPNIAMKTAYVYYIGLSDDLTGLVNLVPLPQSGRELAMEPLVAYVNRDADENYEVTLKYNHRCYHTATIRRMANYMSAYFKKATS
ncbi:MAG: amino acid adenylation domain-containing protein [Bacteroidales bacterium]|nr:amino acid adenylation domain-containing protein [Bacteroidales bacterium]